LTLGPVASADAGEDNAEAEDETPVREAEAVASAENDDPDNPVTQAAAAADTAAPEQTA
jgi:hypothetical protein